jgi:hypothetical protein
VNSSHSVNSELVEVKDVAHNNIDVLKTNNEYAQFAAQIKP